MNQETENKPDFGKIIVFTFLGLLILGGVVFAGIRFSKKEGQQTLPQGTYLGPENNPADQPPTAPLTFTTDLGTPWTSFQGKVISYTFSRPETLPLAVFPDDETDSVAVVWGNIPPEQNILLNLESIEGRNPDYLAKPKEEYVRNWHQYFSGLKDISSLTTFKNSNGLTGYRASFVNTVDQTPNIDIFFEVPDRNDLMIHMANGILDPVIFDRIVDSLNIASPTSTPAVAE
ncbi:hypothetical protein ISS85_04405 [Candidatus Microgenomates bacterium]|nr:hypothetical protein [Candidatus Microgenomates bacterium]